jgi:acrylyl-CoA reductase (NADPH)
MQQAGFRALVLREVEGKTAHDFEMLGLDALPDGDVLVEVTHSCLNYKDGLAVTGKGRVVRRFPMVPGIDLAGTVLESAASDLRPGDKVVATGWGLGEAHWGGYAQRARVRSEWLVPIPRELTPEQAMGIGTAGFTAMLSVLALERAGLRPSSDTPLVVTGASGGVGSIAVALLAKLGYTIAAVTGRADNEAYLRGLGAAEIVERSAMTEPSRPLEKQRWAGGVDTVGGPILARVLAETRQDGAVAACGLAGGTDLPTTVMPFILRGVSLLGINSVVCPRERHLEAWRRLVADLPTATLADVTQVISLSDVPRYAETILAGQVRGRLVVDVGA